LPPATILPPVLASDQVAKGASMASIPNHYHRPGNAGSSLSFKSDLASVSSLEVSKKKGLPPVVIHSYSRIFHKRNQPISGTPQNPSHIVVKSHEISHKIQLLLVNISQ
jgi:hypothetical protein